MPPVEKPERHESQDKERQKAVELARESLAIAEVSYENGVITATELNDARLSLLQTEWELTQSKYSEIVAAARTRYAAGL